jgi:hypothetical protein
MVEDAVRLPNHDSPVVVTARRSRVEAAIEADHTSAYTLHRDRPCPNTPMRDPGSLPFSRS